MSDDIFDFGFTAVDESELEAVQTAQKKSAETSLLSTAAAASARNKQDTLDSLYNAIVPLLNNLKLNPEKEYIYWPQRIDKVEAFESKLLEIYKGK